MSAAAPAEEPGMAPLMALEQVSAGYGPFRAIFDVSFGLREGTALALLGANGAGKTTVARVCSKLVEPTSGRLYFDGHDITEMAAHDVRRLGLAHAPEGRSVFATLTVEENLELEFRQSLGRSGVEDGLLRAYEMFPKLGERRKQTAGTLSGGEQRMLALARVMVDGPRLLIADELSLGLAPLIVNEVYETLARIKDEGTSLLIIEQHIGHALDLADDVVVLVRGGTTYVGPAFSPDQMSEHLMPSG
ncbi:MAG: ABC transporter ATP-binding protein [Actinobacteria bacterium]|nr:MAG: ABC transporter ATP-binding protein [Actinomycetota bacterium]RIK07605.1 MAG: ABC transporter ATP-binding protein [Acidobacteriota bacterium]